MGNEFRFRDGMYTGWRLFLDDNTNPTTDHIPGVPGHWWFLLDEDAGPVIYVDLLTPARNGAMHGCDLIPQGAPGYDVMRQALTDGTRESMEAALTWLLDACAERLADERIVMTPEGREHWSLIVADGRAARDAARDLVTV